MGNRQGHSQAGMPFKQSKNLRAKMAKGSFERLRETRSQSKRDMDDLYGCVQRYVGASRIVNSKLGLVLFYLCFLLPSATAQVTDLGVFPHDKLLSDLDCTGRCIGGLQVSVMRGNWISAKKLGGSSWMMESFSGLGS